jgi:predicted metal-dependent hydrolase
MSKISFTQYGNKRIAFTIVRSSRRKTVGIYIGLNGDVVIRSPQFLNEDKVEEIVRKRARWIIEKQEFINTHSHLGSEKEFVSGEAFSYLGRQYRLKIIKPASKQAEGCKLMSGRFFIGINGDLSSVETRGAVKEALMGWYIGRAKEKVPERVELYARQIGKWPERIEIRDHKSRWGSCSRNGVVRFNWKIMMAPVSILDYVIVHELCHLIHQAHSARFWQKVQTIIPDYAMRRKRLREYSLMLSAFDQS